MIDHCSFVATLCFKEFPDSRITVFTNALVEVSGSKPDIICIAQITNHISMNIQRIAC